MAILVIYFGIAQGSYFVTSPLNLAPEGCTNAPTITTKTNALNTLVVQINGR